MTSSLGARLFYDCWVNWCSWKMKKMPCGSTTKPWRKSQKPLTGQTILFHLLAMGVLPTLNLP